MSGEKERLGAGEEKGERDTAKQEIVPPDGGPWVINSYLICIVLGAFL